MTGVQTWLFRSRYGRPAADGGESRSDQQGETESDRQDGRILRFVLKPEHSEADPEGEDETDQCGQKQKTTTVYGWGRVRRLLEGAGHGKAWPSEGLLGGCRGFALL